MWLYSVKVLELQKKKTVFPNGVGSCNYVRNTSNILLVTKSYFGLFILSQILCTPTQIIVYPHTNNYGHPTQIIVDIV